MIIIKATKLKDVDLDSASRPIQSDYSARYDEAEGVEIREAAKMKNRVKGFINALRKPVRSLIIGMGQRYS